MLTTQDVADRETSLHGATRLRELSAALSEEFGTSFRLFDGSTGEPIGDRQSEGWYAGQAWETSASVRAMGVDGRPHVTHADGGCHRLVLPLRDAEGLSVVAIGDVPALARTDEDVERERLRLSKWVQLVHARLAAQARASVPPREEARNDQLSLSLGALLELNELLRGLGASGESAAFQRRILRRAAAVLRVQSIMWVPAQPDEPSLAEGDQPYSKWECRNLVKTLSESGEWDPSGCLVVNQAASTPLAKRYPRIVNLLAISAREKEQRGCLIAINKTDAKAPSRRPQASACEPAAPPNHLFREERASFVPFRRIDAAVLMPFSELLEIGTANSRRNAQVQELFVGLIRSLIAAIDAKDSYTYGHSERVARVAVELGRELNLPEAELSDIYLGGLLHDIGKIGISDSILRKTDPLTTDELAQIRQHVYIGCKILADFRAIRHLFPLVLYHHERYDGTGYPEGLKGDSIPLHARILAVADSYDAMNSSRSYRPALPRAQIEDILNSGRDIQWDGRIIDAFFRARQRIFEIHQQGVGDSICVALDKGRKPGNLRVDGGHLPEMLELAAAKTGSSFIAATGAFR